MLPPEGIYVGGVDGGVWADCGPSQDGAIHCRIFDSTSGELRYESWFRHCPLVGTIPRGRAVMIDEEGLRMNNALLRRDRPDIFHPPPDVPATVIQDEMRQIAESYESTGVKRDCSPASSSE